MRTKLGISTKSYKKNNKNYKSFHNPIYSLIGLYQHKKHSIESNHPTKHMLVIKLQKLTTNYGSKNTTKMDTYGFKFELKTKT